MPVIVEGNTVKEKATGRVVKKQKSHKKAVAQEQAINIDYARKHGHNIPKPKSTKKHKTKKRKY